MVDQQHDDRADDGDEQAVEVEAGYWGRAEEREQVAADNRADDAEHDVDDDAVAAALDDTAGDEAGDEAQDEPDDDGQDGSRGWWKEKRTPVGARFLVFRSGVR